VLTVVSGPPCSGKTTFVAKRRRPGDLVVDYDDLAQALGSPVRHGHAPAIRRATKLVRDAAIRAAISEHRRGARVWIVDTKPPPDRLDQYGRAGARLVTLRVDRAELHRRADAERPALWHSLIDRW
jgi:hypothetical protein